MLSWRAGTINHTFLTVYHVRKHRIAIIAAIPHEKRISADDSGNIVSLVERDFDVEAIMRFI